MATKLDQFLPIIAIGGVIWFLSRRGMAGANGGLVNGGMNDTGTPGGPQGGGQGPAYVSGGLSDIGVDYYQGEVGLMSHLVERENGQGLTASITWSNNTTDYEGNSITWPSRIIAELGHSTGWGLGGWDNMNDLLGGSQGEAMASFPYGASSGTHTNALSLVMGNEPNPPKDWDLRVRLEMQGSTSAGEPDGVWQEVDRDTHENAVRSIRSEGPSSLAGSIGGIDIWEADVSDSYYFNDYMNSPSARMGNI